MDDVRITAVSSQRYIVGVETPSSRFKLFQIICKNDGSIIVPFPYYKHSSAQLIEGHLRGGRSYEKEGFTVSGPVATSRVKYTHHLDGEAHFSQDGKILTRVRKRANPIVDYGGHLFTVQLQGLQDFAKFSQSDLEKSRRANVIPRYGREPQSLKVVATLNSIAQFTKKYRFSRSVDTSSFILLVEGKTILNVLLSVKQRTETYLLNLSFEEIAPVAPRQPSIFTFMGGFDSPSIALDHSKDTSFLLLVSPAGIDPAQVAQINGTVDYRPTI